MVCANGEIFKPQSFLYGLNCFLFYKFTILKCLRLPNFFWKSEGNKKGTMKKESNENNFA